MHEAPIEGNQVVRQDVPWKQLVVITKRLRYTGETTSELDWKDRVLTQVLKEGWKYPRSFRLYQAIEAVKVSSRRLKQKAPPPPLARSTSSSPRPSDFTRVGELSPKRPANACGCLKRVSGAKALRCTLPRGHDGDHGLHTPDGSVLIVRWGR